MKEFNQDMVKISNIPNILMNTCDSVKYYPLGENYLKLLFDPHFNMLIK